ACPAPRVAARSARAPAESASARASARAQTHGAAPHAPVHPARSDPSRPAFRPHGGPRRSGRTNEFARRASYGFSDQPPSTPCTPRILLGWRQGHAPATGDATLPTKNPWRAWRAWRLILRNSVRGEGDVFVGLGGGNESD